MAVIVAVLWGVDLMIEAEFQGLLWTIVLDLIFFIFCYYVFQKVHKKHLNSREKAPLISDEPPSSPALSDDESETEHIPALFKDKPLSLLWQFEFFQSIFGSIDSESGSGILYLRFLQYSTLFFMIATIIVAPVLITLYILGDNRIIKPSILQTISAGNLPLGSSKLWAVVACFVFITILVYLMIWYYWDDLKAVVKRVTEAVHLSRSQAQAAEEDSSLRTIQITGIQRHLIDEKALFEYFTTHHNLTVEFVHIPQDMSRWFALKEQKSALLNAIERTQLLEAQRGANLSRTSCCGCVNDGLESKLLESELKNTEALIDSDSQTRKPGCGIAFVSFKECPSILQLERTRLNHTREAMRRKLEAQGLNVAEWTITLAPPPSDIIWDNLHVSETNQWFRWVFINFLLFFSMIVLIAPVSVVEFINPLLRSAKSAIHKNSTYPFFVMAIHYVPTLVVFLINSLLLPYLIYLTAEFEKHHTHSSKARSVFRKNVFFMTLNVIIIPTLVLDSISALLEVTYSTNGEKWMEIVGTVFLSSSGHWFVQYMIHATLLGGGAQLMDLSQWLWRWWNLRSAVTASEKKNALQTWPFDFGYWYSARITLFGMALLYSCVVPAILPFALGYFAMCYWVDSHNFRQGLYYPHSDTDGTLEAVTTRMLFGYLALFHVAMAGFFLVQYVDEFMLFGLLLIVSAMIHVVLYFTALIAVSRTQKLDAVDVMKSLMDQPSVQADEKSQEKPLIATDSAPPGHLKFYTHPLLR